MARSAQTGPGLRERTKVRRRREILHTALRLFAERGYDGTTIQDIAEEAGVAPRTVTGYFPSKLDFVTEWPTIRTRRIVELYQQRPTIGFLELVDLWWRDLRATVDPEEAALTRAMALANPGIVALAEAEVSHRAANSGSPLPEQSKGWDDLVQAAGRAAIYGINQAFFRGIAEGRMTDGIQAELLDLMAHVARRTGAGHGSLAFDH